MYKLPFALILAVAALAAPFAVYPMLLMKLLCFGMFACALNLLLGYGGLLSLGHAAFFGSAAYASGYALTRLGWPLEAALLAGVGLSAALGWCMSVLATRRQGIYFSMITLAVAQLVFFAAVQWRDLGGEDGLQSIPRGHLLGWIDLADDRRMYFVVLAFFAAALWLTRRIVTSPFGQVIVAVRDNPARVTSLGYDVDSFKRLLFVLSAVLAGVAGSLKAVVFGVVTLADVSWHLSGTVVLMALLGGLGTQWGPVIGAWLVVLLENELGELGTRLAAITGVPWLAALGESVSIITGLIFMGCVLLFRRGIVGELNHRLQRRAGKRPPRPARAQAQDSADGSMQPVFPPL
jgi:branched-chain amino acid transport system permease protein